MFFRISNMIGKRVDDSLSKILNLMFQLVLSHFSAAYLAWTKLT